MSAVCRCRCRWSPVGQLPLPLLPLLPLLSLLPLLPLHLHPTLQQSTARDCCHSGFHRVNPEAVASIVCAWQPCLKDNMLCAFVDHDRVHVQFSTRESMDRTLSAVKLLVPCCVTSSSWSPPCGPPKHECSERIDIECALPGPPKQGDAKVGAANTAKAILDIVGIENTMYWCPSNQPAQRVLVSVLARGSSLAELTDTVSRINAA